MVTLPSFYKLAASLSLASIVFAEDNDGSTNPSCEAPIDGLPAYNFNSATVSCLSSQCTMPNIPNTPDYNPAIAPGAINGTAVPYCEASCVNPNFTQAQLASAPSCMDYCESSPLPAQGTLENYGWCLYWCVYGKKDTISTMSCVPSIPYHLVTTVIGGFTDTFNALGAAPTDDSQSSKISNLAETSATPTPDTPGIVSSTPGKTNSQPSPSTAAGTAAADAAQPTSASQSSAGARVTSTDSGAERIEVSGGMVAIVAGVLMNFV